VYLKTVKLFLNTMEYEKQQGFVAKGGLQKKPPRPPKKPYRTMGGWGEE